MKFKKILKFFGFKFNNNISNVFNNEELEDLNFYIQHILNSHYKLPSKKYCEFINKHGRYNGMKITFNYKKNYILELKFYDLIIFSIYINKYIFSKKYNIKNYYFHIFDKVALQNMLKGDHLNFKFPDIDLLPFKLYFKEYKLIHDKFINDEKQKKFEILEKFKQKGNLLKEENYKKKLIEEYVK